MCDDNWGGGQGAGTIVPVPQGGGGGAWGGGYGGGWEGPPSGGRFGAGRGRGGQQQMRVSGYSGGYNGGYRGDGYGVSYGGGGHAGGRYPGGGYVVGVGYACGRYIGGGHAGGGNAGVQGEEGNSGGEYNGIDIGCNNANDLGGNDVNLTFDLEKLKDVPKFAGGVRVGCGQRGKNQVNKIVFTG